MRKKWLVFAVSCLGAALYFLPRAPAHVTEYCAFCDAAVLTHQKFYEDDLVIALCTHKPISPGHCLVIPKRHVERFELLTEEEITQIGRVIKKVDRAVTQVFGTSSYLLLQKNGPEAGQSVPHVHVHYIPREAGSSPTIGFLVKIYMADVRGPLSEETIQETVAKLQKAMSG